MSRRCRQTFHQEVQRRHPQTCPTSVFRRKPTHTKPQQYTPEPQSGLSQKTRQCQVQGRMWHYPPPLPVGVQYGTFPLEKTDWQFLTKLNIHLPCEPAIPLLGIYQETGRHMFTQNIIRRYLELLFHWHWNLAAIQMPWAGRSLTHCGTSTAWNTTQQLKGQTTGQATG